MSVFIVRAVQMRLGETKLSRNVNLCVFFFLELGGAKISINKFKNLKILPRRPTVMQRSRRGNPLPKQNDFHSKKIQNYCLLWEGFFFFRVSCVWFRFSVLNSLLKSPEGKRIQNILNGTTREGDKSGMIIYGNSSANPDARS